MTSILTNTSAMVALQTLADINRQLNETNNRVSTGLKIGEAKDSAAYWAISTTTKSDNGALETVREAVALGKATMDVTYAGMESVRENLQKIKELLVAARQPGVDFESVDTEIQGLITDMENKAGAAVINEQNFLSIDQDSTANFDRDIVASFERVGGNISLSTITLDLGDVALYNADATETGLLDASETHGSTSYNLTMFDIASFDLSSGTDVSILEDWIAFFDSKLTQVISAQNTVGVILTRAESQDEFISALIDANDRAVGALVDANMEQESTRLRALQTQQQLSIQSLTIANASSNNVLALFQ